MSAYTLFADYFLNIWCGFPNATMPYMHDSLVRSVSILLTVSLVKFQDYQFDSIVSMAA